MTILHRVKKYYRHSGRDFLEDIYHHSSDADGICIITPRHVLLARPVSIHAHVLDIINPGHHFPKNICDAWHVHLAIGPLKSLSQYLRPLSNEFPYITFQRGQSSRNPRLRIYHARQFIHLLQTTR